MTSYENIKTKRVPSDLVAKCHDWAVAVAERYGSGDKMHAMPWTRDQLTKEELQPWLASRKAVGAKIDIETCELGRWAACDCDPYGVRPDLPEEMQQVGTNRFVRSPESIGWVNEEDLPLAKVNAMYDRIERERLTYARAHPEN